MLMNTSVFIQKNQLSQNYAIPGILNPLKLKNKLSKIVKISIGYPKIFKKKDLKIGFKKIKIGVLLEKDIGELQFPYGFHKTLKK
jgi:hypothetical protein